MDRTGSTILLTPEEEKIIADLLRTVRIGLVILAVFGGAMTSDALLSMV